jgi:hypothetical protein
VRDLKSNLGRLANCKTTVHTQAAASTVVSTSSLSESRPSQAHGLHSDNPLSLSAMSTDHSTSPASRNITSAAEQRPEDHDSTPFATRTSSYVDREPKEWKDTIPFLQNDLCSHMLMVPRDDWLRLIFGQTVAAWAGKLQDLKDQCSVDLANYMAANEQKIYYKPFSKIVNTILERCRDIVPDLPAFPVDDLRFYKSDSTVLMGDRYDGLDPSYRKPDVVAVRYRELGWLKSKDEIYASDELQWSDVLLSVEFKCPKSVRHNIVCGLCLRSKLLTRD